MVDEVCASSGFILRGCQSLNHGLKRHILLDLEQ